MWLNGWLLRTAVSAGNRDRVLAFRFGVGPRIHLASAVLQVSWEALLSVIVSPGARLWPAILRRVPGFSAFAELV